MVSRLNLQPELVKAIEELGFSELTDIQSRTMPLILEGKDVIGQSQTGSGKTAAFGFPILQKITSNHGLQALILVPTRELCEQVATEMRKFSKYKKMHISAVYGGVSINPQIHSLQNADIVVATPGRMLDHLQRGTANLSKVKMLVLDEADKMFEMGFIDDVKNIISQTPSNRQTLLFSATMSQQVYDIVKHHMKSPEKVKVQSYVDQGKMAQYFYQVNSRDKFSLLVHLLKQHSAGLALIFCATRNRVDVLSKNLYKSGVEAMALHGGLSQNKRKRTIELFHGNRVDVLVASDVAARGLDIKNITQVINYDIPKTAKEYIHRIGRTARAGKEGKVISLLSEQDHDNMRSVLDDRSLIIEELKLPEFQRIPFFASQKNRFKARNSQMRGPGYGHTGQRHGFGEQRRNHQRSQRYFGERRHKRFGERRNPSSNERERSHHRFS